MPLSKLIAVPFASAAAWFALSLSLYTKYEQLHCTTVILTVVFGVALLAANRKIKQERSLRMNEQRRFKTEHAIANRTRMLAHDMRVPLKLSASYLRTLEQLTKDHELKKIIRQFERNLERNITSVEHMISDVLATGTTTYLVKECSNLTQILTCILGDQTESYGEKRLFVDVELTHSTQLDMDAMRCERVLSNLLENAFEATPESGSITIRSHGFVSDGAYFTELSICNSGSFIPEEKRALIFDAFFTQGKSQGTGLGLTIVKEIIDELGGNIRCESCEIHGTTFVLHLPATQEPERGDTTQPVAKKLVVVEDNAFFRAIWQKHFSGAEVVCYESPEHFFAAVNEQSVALNDISALVTDFYFAHSAYNGASFAQALTEQGFRQRIFVTSSAPEAVSEHAHLFSGFLARIPKTYRDLMRSGFCEGANRLSNP